MTKAEYSDLSLMKRLLGQARPYWGHLAAALALGLLAAPLNLLNPVPLKIVIDNVLGSEPLPAVIDLILPDFATGTWLSLLLAAVVMQVTLALIGQVRGTAAGLIQTYAGERMVLDFRARIFRHMQRLSFSYHDIRGTADSVYRIQSDAPSIRELLVNGLIPLVSSAATFLSMAYVTVRIDWQLAAVGFSVAPVLFLLTRAHKTRMRPKYQRVKELESGAMGVVNEVISGLRVVRAFGAEDREQDRFVNQSGEGLQARLRIALARGLYGITTNGTVAVGSAAVLFMGVLHIRAGTLTTGELLIVLAYVAGLFGPMWTISEKVGLLQSSLASAHRLFELLAEIPDVTDHPNARRMQRARGEVAFEDVSFAYETGVDVLSGVSFDVPAGTRVGVAGHTGAGKSTLLNLLTRFYDPTRGRILLDGLDLRELKLADLRNQFAIMLQEPVLFSTSIRENIAYARPGATEGEIVAAAKAAGAHAFIAALPDGYETGVGERGVRLSGGERQRISLARAFLKDAPILILDEPTSSVDMGTESGIIDAIERLMKGRTTFMIAHRLSTLETCAVIFVFEGGRLVDVRRDVPAAISAAVAGGGF
jgi:ATP-binding cassette subfamily B protein